MCLYGANTADGPDAVAALTADVPGVVAVDEEGGDVTRLHTRDGSPVLGALALGAADLPDLTRAVGRHVGAELASLGITMTLAPVADVNSRADNPVIGTRSFGADPSLVATHVAAWTEGLQETGVAACVKHWPGHGDTDLDSHLALPRVDATDDVLAERELVPFASAVKAGAAAVMTSHVVVSAWDADSPATLSAASLGRLRHDLGFAGVIVSDALDMAGASAGRGIPEAAVLALAAGCDLLCLGTGTGNGRRRRRARPRRPGRDRGRGPRGPADRGATGRRGGAGRRPAPAGGRLHAPGSTPPCSARARPEPSPSRATCPTCAARGWSASTRPARSRWATSPGDCRSTPRTTSCPTAPSSSRCGTPTGSRRSSHALTRVAGRTAVVVEWGWPGPATTALPRICARGWSQPGRDAVVDVLRAAGWDR